MNGKLERNDSEWISRAVVLFPLPASPDHQHRDIGLRKQLRLRTQPARRRTRRDKIKFFADSFDFLLVHN